MLPEPASGHPVSMSHGRGRHLLHAEKLLAFTVGYNALEGLIAVAAGVMAGSAALSGFGIDSVIEVTSAIFVWWRLRSERTGRSSGRVDETERRAARFAGALLMLLALGVLTESVRQFVMKDRPNTSLVGVSLTALSLVVMPLLARRKLRAAAALESRALRADAHETLACAWMSGATLMGLGLNSAFGWWWADPAAALGLV